MANTCVRTKWMFPVGGDYPLEGVSNCHHGVVASRHLVPVVADSAQPAAGAQLGLPEGAACLVDRAPCNLKGPGIHSVAR